MSQSYLAIPAKSNQILSFPSQNKPISWKARFERAHDQGKWYLLSFPFSTIKEKKALLVLFDAAPALLKDFPEVLDKFCRDAEFAVEAAEESIAEERQKNAPGDPGALIQFRAKNLKENNAR